MVDRTGQVWVYSVRYSLPSAEHLVYLLVLGSDFVRNKHNCCCYYDTTTSNEIPNFGDVYENTSWEEWNHMCRLV